MSFIVSYPTSGLEHLELQRVSERLTLQQRHSVTAGQAWEHGPQRQETGVWNQLWETGGSPLHHSPNIQTLLCQSSCLEKQKYSDDRQLPTCNVTTAGNVGSGNGFSLNLVKAEEWNFATDVDAWWTDAEDALSLQPALGVDSASGDGSRQGRRHCDGHNIQAPHHQLQPGCLHTQPAQSVLSLYLLLACQKKMLSYICSFHLHWFWRGPQSCRWCQLTLKQEGQYWKKFINVQLLLN